MSLPAKVQITIGSNIASSTIDVPLSETAIPKIGYEANGLTIKLLEAVKKAAQTPPNASTVQSKKWAAPEPIFFHNTFPAPKRQNREDVAAQRANGRNDMSDNDCVRIELWAPERSFCLSLAIQRSSCIRQLLESYAIQTGASYVDDCLALEREGYEGKHMDEVKTPNEVRSINVCTCVELTLKSLDSAVQRLSTSLIAV